MANTGVSIIDTSEVPWEPHVLAGSTRKMLDRDEDTGGYVHLRQVPPGGAPAGRQLHLSVRETFFWLHGDLPCWEYDSPLDLDGHLLVYRRGTFMDRWPLSIHGRRPTPESRNGAEFLIWTSGGAEFETDPEESIPVPFSPDPGNFGESFTSPTVIDTDSLPWSPHPRTAGLAWRSLDADTDDPRRHPISLVQIPPCWQAPEDLIPARRRCWVYGVQGSVPVRFDDTVVRINEGVFARWGTGTSVKLAPEPTDVGCTLLCVGHALEIQ